MAEEEKKNEKKEEETPKKEPEKSEKKEPVEESEKKEKPAEKKDKKVDEPIKKEAEEKKAKEKPKESAKKSALSKRPPLSAWEEEPPKPLPPKPADGSPCPATELPPVLNWFGKAGSMFAQNIFMAVLTFAAASLVYIGANHFGFRLAELIGNPESGIGFALVKVFAGISWLTAGLVQVHTIYLLTVFLAKVLVPAFTAGVLGAALMGMYGRWASGKRTSYIAMVTKALASFPSLIVAYLIAYGYIWATFKLIGPMVTGTKLLGIRGSLLGKLIGFVIILTVLVIGGVALITIFSRLFSIFTIRKIDAKDSDSNFGNRFVGIFGEFKKFFGQLLNLKTWWRFKWVLYFFAWFAVVPVLGWFVMNIFRDKTSAGGSMSSAVRRLRAAPIPCIIVGAVVTALALIGVKLFAPHLGFVSYLDAQHRAPQNVLTLTEEQTVEKNNKTMYTFSLSKLQKEEEQYKEVPDSEFEVEGASLETFPAEIQEDAKTVKIEEYWLADENWEPSDKKNRNIQRLGVVGRDLKLLKSDKKKAKVQVQKTLISDLLSSLMGLALIFPLAGVFLGISYNELNYEVDEKQTSTSYASLLFAIIVVIGIVFALL